MRNVAFALGGVLCLVFPKIILGLQTFFYRDFGMIAYPVVFHHRESFWRGELPLWNPLSNCGAPFLAQWGTMVLYPFSLFYLLLPLPWSLNVFCLIHLLLAGVGVYRLAWDWTQNRFAAGTAAILMMFNGVTLSCLIWPNYLVALGWMPWIVLWAGRATGQGGRSILITALFAAFQMLAGVPEIVILTWLLVGALWVLPTSASCPTPRPRSAARLLIVVLVVSGLCAVQLLPFFDLLAHSQRVAGSTAMKWAMPSWGWGNFLVPLFHAFQSWQGIFFQTGQEFFSSTYLGVPTLVLAGLAFVRPRQNRVWVLGGLSILCMWMATGDQSLLYRWTHQAFPWVGLARYPIKFLLLLVLTLPLLAAYGIATLQTVSPRHARRVLVPCTVMALVGIIVVLWMARHNQFPLDQWTLTWRNGLARAVFLLASSGLLLWLTRKPAETGQPPTTPPFSTPHVASTLSLRKQLPVFGFMLVLLADFLVHVPNQNPTLPAAALAPGLWKLSQNHPLPQTGSDRVMITPYAEQQLLHSRVQDLYKDLLGKRLALWSHLNLIEQIPKVNGSSTLQIREQMELQKILYASTNSHFPQLMEFLGVSLVSAPGQVVEWTSHSPRLPWVTAGQMPVFADPPATLQALTNGTFNPRSVVYLPETARPSITVTNSSQVKILSQSNSYHRIDLQLDAPETALVVVAQSFYNPWRAFVDGKQTPLWRANYAFQALQIPAGTHQVQLIYQDRKLALGALISLATLLGCAVSWRFLKR